MLDNDVDLSDNFVDLSNLYVDMSDFMSTFKINFVIICMTLIGQEHIFEIQSLTSE